MIRGPLRASEDGTGDRSPRSDHPLIIREATARQRGQHADFLTSMREVRGAVCPGIQGRHLGRHRPIGLRQYS
eukprot:1186794-Prorocentrum_minimum.AAC.1